MMRIPPIRNSYAAHVRVSIAALVVVFTTLLQVTTYAAQIAQGYTKTQWSGTQPPLPDPLGGDVADLFPGATFHGRTVPAFPAGVPWTTAIGFYLPDTTDPIDGNTERMECSGGGNSAAWLFYEGEEVWIDFWIYLSSPFPQIADTSRSLILSQMHVNAGNTQAVLKHDYRADETIILSEAKTPPLPNIMGQPFSTALVLNTWVRHTYHIKWSKTTAGFLNYYRNGVLMTSQTNWKSLGTGTSYDHVYPKIGFYRSSYFNEPNVAFYGGYGIYDSNPLPTAPAVPTGLTATAVSGTQVNLVVLR